MKTWIVSSLDEETMRKYGNKNSNVFYDSGSVCLVVEEEVVK